MNDILLLSRLEFARFRQFTQRGHKLGRYYMIILTILLISVALIFLRGTNGYFLFGIGMISSFSLIFITTIINLSTVLTNEQKEWWLMYPFSRSKLVLGRTLGYVLFGLYEALYLYFICLVIYLIMIGCGWFSVIPYSHFILFALVSLMTYIIPIPIAVSFGMSGILFNRGWARVGHIISLVIFQAPFVAGSAYYHIGRITNYRLMDMFHILTYIPFIILIGYPLSFLILWMTTTYGIKRLGDIKYESLGARKKQLTQTTNQSAPIHRKRSKFMALYSLEASRFPLFNHRSPLVFRVILYTVYLALLVGGFFAATYQSAVIGIPNFVFIMAFGFVTFYGLNMNIYDFQKQRGEWWLGLPYSRRMLLGARVLSLWIHTIKMIFFGLLSLGVGMSIRWLFHPLPMASYMIAGRYIFATSLLMISLITINVLLIQFFPVTIKNPGLVILIFPIYFSYYIGIKLQENWINIDHIVKGPIPHFWTHMIELIIIGIPLGIYSFHVGAKHLNYYMNMHRSNTKGWLNR